MIKIVYSGTGGQQSGLHTASVDEKVWAGILLASHTHGYCLHRALATRYIISYFTYATTTPVFK